tara:strand:- start:52 stop:225 length:174 start_codon:yes stop_codon:yes gene_type:complete
VVEVEVLVLLEQEDLVVQAVADNQGLAEMQDQDNRLQLILVVAVVQEIMHLVHLLRL